METDKFNITSQIWWHMFLLWRVIWLQCHGNTFITWTQQRIWLKGSRDQCKWSVIIGWRRRWNIFLSIFSQLFKEENIATILDSNDLKCGKSNCASHKDFWDLQLTETSRILFSLCKKLQQKRSLCLSQPTAASPPLPWIFHGGGHTRLPWDTISCRRNLSKTHQRRRVNTTKTAQHSDASKHSQAKGPPLVHHRSDSLTPSHTVHQSSLDTQQYALIEPPERAWTSVWATEPPQHTACSCPLVS